jgi:heptosyltransferase-2
MSEHRRILVIRTDRIGDVVLATPLIRALRQTFPSAFIAAMVRPHTKDILLKNPHLNDILLDNSENKHRGRGGFWRQVKTLRRYKFDTALLLLPTERLAWMLLCAGIRTRISVGLILYEVLTLMKTVSRRKYVPLRHEADSCLDLGRAIGVKDDNLAVEVFLLDSEREGARDILRSRGISNEARDGSFVVGIHPGGGKSAPNWHIERYVELVDLLLQRDNLRIVVTGSQQEKDFSKHFRRLDSLRIADLIGQVTLRELIALISHYAVLVSASTGPMHIAAALKVPTVSMFCPLTACSPRLWGPQGNVAEIVLPPENYCEHQCPGDPHICDFEGGVDPTTIDDRVMEMLARLKPKS